MFLTSLVVRMFHLISVKHNLFTMDPNSIVDTLKTKGMASDFLSRSNLAKTYGITNYTGAPDQNIQLLQKVNGGSPVATVVTPTTTTPVTTTTPTVTVPAPKPVDPTEIARLAGEKGMTVADYQKFMDGTNGTYGVDKQQIGKDLGIPALETSVFTAPSKSTVDIFNEAYTTAGLGQVDTSIQALMDEIATRRGQLKDATDTINNNPFLSEKTRVGQGKLRLDQAETDINNKVNELNTLRQWKQDQLTNINNKILMSTNDFKTNQELNAKKLDYLTKQRDTMVTDKTTNAKSDVSGKATLEYLMNLPKKALTNGTTWDPATGQWIAPPAKASTKTTTVKGTVVSGGLTYSPIDMAEDSRALEGSRGSDGHVDPTVYQNLYKAWVANGGLLKDFLAKFPPKNYVNPANTWLPSYLMPTVSATTKKKSTTTTINDL